MESLVARFAKKIIFNYTKYGSPYYPYNITPGQLSRLVEEINRLEKIEGNIAEIGVARGMTTRFVCEHLRNSGNFKGTYFAIDTFNSFTQKDLLWEINKRGKLKTELAGFGYNNFKRWSKNFSDFSFVEPIKADCSTVDYSKIGPLKLVFLDVDLYLPTINSLRLIYENLSQGGIILVDDVTEQNRWDGAFQAYNEFCSEISQPIEIFDNKCGVIKR